MRRALVVLLLAGAQLDAATLRDHILVGKPGWLGSLSSSLPLVVTNNAIDASGEKAAFIFRVNWLDSSLTTRSIARVHFRVSGASNAQTLRVSLQDVDASGDPDGTQDQYRDITPVASRGHRTELVTSDGTDTGNLRAVSRGTLLAVVIEFASATGNVTIASRHTQTHMFGDVYDDLFTASWAKAISNSAASLPIAIEFSDGGFAQTPGLMPFVGHTGDADAPMTSVTFNNSSTPDERGNVWVPDQAQTVTGLWAHVDYDSAVDVVLYDSGSAVLASATFPSSAVRVANTAGFVVAPITPVTVSAGSTYRIVIKPTSTSNVVAGRWSATTNGALDAWYGTGYYSTSRTDAGAWSEVDTDVIYCGPVVAAIASGGGVSAARVPNGM